MQSKLPHSCAHTRQLTCQKQGSLVSSNLLTGRMNVKGASSNLLPSRVNAKKAFMDMLGTVSAKGSVKLQNTGEGCLHSPVAMVLMSIK